MKRSSSLVLAVAALACVGLNGCVAFSEQHPTSESRYATPSEQAFWIDRRWRQDIADYWSRELDRQSSARMAREFAN
jgi:hypothetical protein